MTSKIRKMSGCSYIALICNFFITITLIQLMLTTSFRIHAISALGDKSQVVVGVVHVWIWCNACEIISFVQDGLSYNIMQEKRWSIITV